MSEMQVEDFTQRAETLSYDDTLMVISILLNRLRFHSSQQINHSEPDFLEEMFAIADKEPELHKSERAWARDELHRY